MILTAIKFNHDSASSTGDAINIRRNATQVVLVPEWRIETANTAESIAVYSLKETTGNTLTIQAKFKKQTTQAEQLHIRALVSSPPSLPQEWRYWLDYIQLYYPTYYLYYSNYINFYWSQLWKSGWDVLGEVKATLVDFNAGEESGYQTFELLNPKIWSRGVGIHYVRWQWQYRETPSDPWETFANTHHKIYTILQLPTDPWQQTPYSESNTQLPWTDVLDYACSWASATTTLDSAAARITHSTYDLGINTLEYGCAVSGLTAYAFPEFNCTAFLERLRGDIGRGPYVNCSDCATIVSTFANILGCDLSQAQMGTYGRPFSTNPILGIGLRYWGYFCGVGEFNFHEVAWKGNCTVDDNIFDACLKLDISTPPLPPYDAVLPANMPFGKPGDNYYRDLLATTLDRQFCEAQPNTRLRRMVY
jgi:hypothetical protein